MPLKNPPPVGLKKLKKIIGHKGPGFAQLVGVPYDTLKSIESGRGNMSKDVAHKIKLATGVMIKSLYKKNPQNINGAAYTEGSFHWWRGNVLSFGREGEAGAEAEKLAQYIGFFTKVLLLAAVENGKKVTYGSLHLEIASLIRDLADEHGLGPSINRALRRFPIEDEWELTKQEWMAAPELRAKFKSIDQDLRRVGDYDKHKAKRTLYPAWNPEGAVREQVLKPKS